MRLLTLKATGTAVKAGDVVMTFDPSVQENTLEEQRALLREADMEMAQREAEAAVLAAQDKVSLLTTGFDIRKAELDIKGNELLSAIKARQNELTLEEARRQRAQIEEDVRSHATTSQAAMAVAREKRMKAQLAMDQAQRAIDSMSVRAPMDGIISVSANRDGVNFFFNGMTLPEYREGDSVSSGRRGRRSAGHRPRSSSSPASRRRSRARRHGTARDGHVRQRVGDPASRDPGQRGS